ncbi:MAG: hypothetical protein ACD_78C00174G0002 [uncultured bacterium (gcode 4)]|uniref:Uncharacterized protein n=1 Tax=uncultured bacterium (gcode 4) TaxID=1234023 RepID=K1YCL6_9BACT|nr:MAG: hypothetical protein ACD_78C00174G0002 [uncultured bacterium (gcode 4)]
MDYRRIKNLGVIILIVLTFGMITVFADNLPKPEKMGLPFESTSDATMPIVKIIKESIKYVGILAMLALSWWGIQFLISYGADEKVKNAKNTIIYSLVGVVLSITAYAIVDIVNSITL